MSVLYNDVQKGQLTARIQKFWNLYCYYQDIYDLKHKDSFGKSENLSKY